MLTSAIPSTSSTWETIQKRQSLHRKKTRRFPRPQKYAGAYGCTQHVELTILCNSPRSRTAKRRRRQQQQQLLLPTRPPLVSIRLHLPTHLLPFLPSRATRRRRREARREQLRHRQLTMGWTRSIARWRNSRSRTARARQTWRRNARNNRSGQIPSGSKSKRCATAGCPCAAFCHSQGKELTSRLITVVFLRAQVPRRRRRAATHVWKQSGTCAQAGVNPKRRADLILFPRFPPDWQYATSSPLTFARPFRQQPASRHLDSPHIFLPRDARARVALRDRCPRTRAVRGSRDGTRRERRMVLIRAPVELPPGSAHVLGGAATSRREPVVRCPRCATVSRRHALAALRDDGAAGRQRRVLDASFPRAVRTVGTSPSDVHVRRVPPPLQPHREPRALHRDRSKSCLAGQRWNVANCLRVGQDRPQY